MPSRAIVTCRSVGSLCRPGVGPIVGPGHGILDTTSWFTPRSWEKAREHGRIELIDGNRLVYLIKEHLGKEVLIGIKTSTHRDYRASTRTPCVEPVNRWLGRIAERVQRHPSDLRIG